jgi:hypothetical protein
MKHRSRRSRSLRRITRASSTSVPLALLLSLLPFSMIDRDALFSLPSASPTNTRALDALPPPPNPNPLHRRYRLHPVRARHPTRIDRHRSWYIHSLLLRPFLQTSPLVSSSRSCVSAAAAARHRLWFVLSLRRSSDLAERQASFVRVPSDSSRKSQVSLYILYSPLGCSRTKLVRFRC